MATWSLRDLDPSDLIGIVRYVRSEVRDLDIYFKCRFACDRGGGRRGQDGSPAPQGCGVQTPGARAALGGIFESGVRGSGSRREGWTWAQPRRIGRFAGHLWEPLRRPPLTQGSVRL